MTPELVDQLPDLERQADELERKAEAVRQIIAGVRALNGDAKSILLHKSFESHRTAFVIAPPDREGPRGPAAVLRVMHGDPQRAWKVVELKRELLRRGWAPTPKAVEASVKRLRLSGKVEAVSYGHYRLARDEVPTGDATERRDAWEVRTGDGQTP
jgi:hypothetical protein